MSQSEQSPPSDNTEPSIPIEQAVAAAVKEWLSSFSSRPEHLKRLLISEQLRREAAAIAEGFPLREQLPSDIAELVLLELKHQIRQLVEPKTLRQERISAITQFLDGDLQACLKNAAQKAVNARIREPHLLESLAQEASLDINQILLQAKKEFSEGGPEQDAVVRQSVMHKIHALDSEYSVSSILEALQKHLGLSFVAQVRRSLLRKEQAVLAMRPPPKLAKLNDHLRAVQGEIEHAVVQAKQQFADPLLQQQVLEDLRRLADHFTSLEALQSRLPTSP